jgi:hypothetical protein
MVDGTFRATNWIVVDQSGNVHARIKNADFDNALAMARTAFPEFPDGELKVILYRKASERWRLAAKDAVLLTAERCAARGITWRPPLRRLAAGLQQHFERVGGAR